MGFQIQLLETELEEERKRNKVDLSALDKELKSDYESRLRAEMASLRRVYEEQTEKAKTEFMYLHSAKVDTTAVTECLMIILFQLSELQSALSTERSSAHSGRTELKVRQLSSVEKMSASLYSRTGRVGWNSTSPPSPILRPRNFISTNRWNMAHWQRY